MKQILIFIIPALLVSSCDLIEPSDIENPNVVEGDFLGTDGAMAAWVNGANASMAERVGRICEYAEILSDNYYNNYTRSSKQLDLPRIDYRSGEVGNVATFIGEMIESARYGLETVAKADAATTPAQLFNLRYILGYAHILAGELFVALPMEAKGEPKAAAEHFAYASEVLNEALTIASDDEDKAFITTLLARSAYGQGHATEAADYARKALRLAPAFHHDVRFDGANSVVNSLNEYLAAFMFQPLPRLDFLDPKYPSGAYWDKPICIAKAEEDWLILAEASLAAGKLDEARDALRGLLALVATRPRAAYADTADDRNNGGVVVYPNGSDWLVAASAADTPRAGLMRQHGPGATAYALPTLSGTSVTDEMIDSAATHDALLETVYLMRQEIFIAEGRRATDLGIRFPLPETEAALHRDLPTEYTALRMPPFVPQNGELDAFTIDEATHTVTILHNMNRAIVENARTAYVVPFEN